MANLRKALQSSYNWLVAAEMFRPASRVCRTWLRSSTSPWLCDAIEWVKTTRNGVKEEKSRTLNNEYFTSGGTVGELTNQNILACLVFYLQIISRNSLRGIAKPSLLLDIFRS